MKAHPIDRETLQMPPIVGDARDARWHLEPSFALKSSGAARSMLVHDFDGGT